MFAPIRAPDMANLQVGGRAPHHGNDLFLFERCGNRSVGVR